MVKGAVSLTAWAVYVFGTLQAHALGSVPHIAVVSPDRRYMSTLANPENYRYSWSIDGYRCSYSSTSGQYISRSTLADAESVNQAAVEACADQCDSTSTCGFFHLVQMSGGSEGSILCALYTKKQSKDSADITSGTTSSGGDVVSSYGFTRNTVTTASSIASSATGTSTTIDDMAVSTTTSAETVTSSDIASSTLSSAPSSTSDSAPSSISSGISSSTFSSSTSTSSATESSSSTTSTTLISSSTTSSTDGLSSTSSTNGLISAISSISTTSNSLNSPASHATSSSGSKKPDSTSATNRSKSSSKHSSKASAKTSIVSKPRSTHSKTSSTSSRISSHHSSRASSTSAPKYPKPPPGAHLVQFQGCQSSDFTVPMFVSKKYPSKDDPSSASIVWIVQHGLGRDFDDYFTSVYNVVGDAGLVIAPNFYAQGDTAMPNGWFKPKTNLAWHSNDWADGDDAIAPSGVKACSSLDVYDSIIDSLRDTRKYPNLKQIFIVAHSRGSAFATRYGSLSSNTDVQYVLANAPVMPYFTADRPIAPVDCSDYNTWGYGWASGLPRYVAARSSGGVKAFRHWISQNITLMTGDLDTYSRDTTGDQGCEVQSQGGQNRRDRGYAFWAYINLLGGTNTDVTDYYGYDHLAKHVKSVSPSSFNARHCVVPGVAHDNHGMFLSDCGKAAIFGASKIPAGPGPIRPP